MNVTRIAALTASLGVLASALAAAGIVYHPDLRVATGDSMEPTIQGPAVAHCAGPVDSIDDVQVGDIVVTKHSFRDGRDDGQTVMHRVIEKRPNTDSNLPPRVVTQGDANDDPDGLIAVSEVQCKHTRHVTLPV